MPVDADADIVSQAAQTALGSAPDRLERLSRGGNSQSYRIDMADRTIFAKQYFTHAGDTRDRLGAEYGMLSFLWRQGVRCVPEPLASFPDKHIGFFSFVEGTSPVARQVSRQDVLALANFLGDLWDLRQAPGAAQLPDVADAMYSIDHCAQNVASRIAVVRQCATDSDTGKDFAAFVRDELSSGYERVQRHVAANLSRFRMDPSSTLERPEMTLNPADHSFINVLRRPDGSLVFLDFEYAGWDDPVPMICNPCLQPDIPIPDELIDVFVRTVCDRIDTGPEFAQRMVCAYPLLAFKWVLIVLNEFLPVSSERRRFAGTRPEDRRAAQLAKAKRLLQRLLADLETESRFEHYL